MKPVSPNRGVSRCAKCDARVGFEPATGRCATYDENRNILVVVCIYCHYVWFERCADDTEPTTMELTPVKYEFPVIDGIQDKFNVITENITTAWEVALVRIGTIFSKGKK